MLRWGQPLGPGLTGSRLAQVEASWPGQQPWLRDYCASGLYLLTLLLEGYGFSEDTWPSIAFRKQVAAPGRVRREGWGPALTARP